MSNQIETLEKICRALEEQKLWGLLKDAEGLKLLLQEQGKQDEIRSALQTPMASDALEHPGEVPHS